MERRSFLKSVLLVPFAFSAAGEAKDRSVLLLESVVAGFQYYRGERVWRNLKVDAPLRLVREPGNSYDEKAIEVYWRGEKLGYVPRVDNSVLAQLMDRGVPLRARISGLRRSYDPWERVSFEVEMEV